MTGSLSSLTLRKLTGRRGSRSLGASGAVCALFAIVCINAPETRFSVMFFDELFPHSVNGSRIFTIVTVLEIVGIALNWDRVDHAAHFGGLLFGSLYAQKQPQMKYMRYAMYRPSVSYGD